MNLKLIVYKTINQVIITVWFSIFIAVISFVLTYIYSGQVTEAISKAGNIQDSAALFGLEALRFLTATGVAILAGYLLVKIGVVNQQMAKET